MHEEIYDPWFLDELNSYYDEALEQEWEEQEEREGAEYLIFEQEWKKTEARNKEWDAICDLEFEMDQNRFKDDHYDLHNLEKIPTRTKKGYKTYFKNSF